MRVTLIISSLSSGGAERVLVLLSKGLHKLGYNITVVTIFGDEADFYTLPKGVTRKSLNLGGESRGLAHAVVNNFKLIQGLRKSVLDSKADVVISFIDKTNIITIVSLFNTGIPVIVTEHSDPETMQIGKTWSKLRKVTYPFATKIVSVSKGVDNYFSWVRPEKRTVIFNPVDLEEVNSKQEEAINMPSTHTIMSMGRLIPEKGFDILISAFSLINKKYPNWQLIILGEGIERRSLETQIEKLGLNNIAKLPGRFKNPFPILKEADIFVSSSRSEGFGNVIIEAMAAGVPVIATNCPGGSKELISNNETGLLVETENEYALAKAIEELIVDKRKRTNLRENALTSVSKFYLENVTLDWDKLFKGLMSK